MGLPANKFLTAADIKPGGTWEKITTLFMYQQHL